MLQNMRKINKSFSSQEGSYFYICMKIHIYFVVINNNIKEEIIMTKMDYIARQLIETDGEYEDVIGFITDMHFHQEPNGDIFANDSENTIQLLFSAGYCYHFAIILNHLFPGGTICLAAPFGHIVYVYKEFAFDINGVSDVETHCFIPVSELSQEELNDFIHVPGRHCARECTPDNIIINWIDHCLVKRDKHFIFALTANDFPNSRIPLDEKYKKTRKSVVEEYATVLSNYYRKNNNYTHKEADELKSAIIRDFA